MNSRVSAVLLLLLCVLSSCSQAEKALAIKGTVINTQLNNNGVEALVKIDDGVFQIDRVEIKDGVDIALHENVVSDIEASSLFRAKRKLVSNSEKILSGYPEIRQAIQERIDSLRSQLVRRYSIQEPWVSYNMLQEGEIGGSRYFTIVLTDSDRTYGGYLYFVESGSNRFRSIQLVDTFSSMLSCEVIDKRTFLVFTENDTRTLVSLVHAP